MPIVDPKVEIEFTAGTWTNVTADVDLSIGISIKYGRTSEFSDAQTATCDFQLANHLGTYTPKAQLLADGTTAHPFYPNVTPRKRVRVSNSFGNRFLGYIKSWSPLLENGVRPIMAVSASDRQDQLSRINLASFYEEELAATSPACSYLLNDTPVNSGAAAVFLDSLNLNPPLVQVNTGPVPFTTGADLPMPQPDGLTGVTVSASAANGNALLGSVTLDPANFAMSLWLTVPVLAAGNALIGTAACTFSVKTGAGFYASLPEPTGDVYFQIGYGTGLAGSTLVAGFSVYVGVALTQVGSTVVGSVPDDGAPHHYMVIGSTSGGTQTVTAYVDGVSIGSTSFVAGQISTPDHIDVVTFAGPSASPVLGPIAAWANAPASTVPATLAAAGNGFASELSGARVARLLRYAGLAPAEYSIAAGVETLSGAQGIRGKSVVTACQDIATTEGAGSSFYIDTDGLARFCDRTFRKPAAPNVTLSASLDLDGPFAPTFDDLTLVNQSSVTRSGGNTLSFTDAASVTAYGQTSDSATTYASTDGAALNLAQQRVSAQSKPGIRIPQFTVDLLTSGVSGSVFAAPRIGHRYRINTLPVGVNATTQVDVIIEGWSESIGKTSWALTFDASPADIPARAIWDDTKYGRWGPGSTMTLTAAITAAATSISVTTTAGNPTFTLAAGAYPLPIKIGEEEMTITAAPGSSASPQTLTVTRGTSSTRAAAQAIGAGVDLSPSPRWAL